MKKALAMLLLAGLAFLPMASFADVVEESLGQGAGFEAALNTGSSDLVQIFPQKAEEFASAVFYRYGEPGDYGPGNLRSVHGWDEQFPFAGADNWMGIIDKKLGIGTLGIYTNVPVNYFTNDAGGHPDLGIRGYEHLGYGPGWSGPNWGTTTNDWAEIVQGWTAYFPPDLTTNPTGIQFPPESWLYGAPIYFATPQNKLMVVYADQGFGLSLNYGDVQGVGRSDLNANTYTDGDDDDVVAGEDLGWKKHSDGAMEFGGKVGYGTKDAGVFSSLDVSGSFELGTLDVTRQNIHENNTADGSVVNSNISVKDGNGGIYDARLALLATKDSDEMTQIRLSVQGIMSKLGTETLVQNDGPDNDGNFADDGSQSKRQTSYDNVNIMVNAGVVHKIEAGNGRVVASMGVNYRDQSLKDDMKAWDIGDQEYGYYGFPSWNAEVHGQIIQVPVRVGVEQALTGWLTLRLGASTNALRLVYGKALLRSDVSADNSGFEDTLTINTSSDAFQNVEFNTGLGVALGNFTFDMLLDQGFLEDNMLRDIRPGAGVLVDGDLVQLYKFQATFKY